VSFVAAGAGVASGGVLVAEAGVASSGMQVAAGAGVAAGAWWRGAHSGRQS
jgi:hypothetical protein